MVEGTMMMMNHKIIQHFRMPTGYSETITAWKSKGLSDERIKPTTTRGKSLAPKLKWIHNSKIAVKFKESCLKQGRATFTHSNVVNFLLSMN